MPFRRSIWTCCEGCQPSEHREWRGAGIAAVSDSLATQWEELSMRFQAHARCRVRVPALAVVFRSGTRWRLIILKGRNFSEALPLRSGLPAGPVRAERSAFIGPQAPLRSAPAYGWPLGIGYFLACTAVFPSTIVTTQGLRPYGPGYRQDLPPWLCRDSPESTMQIQAWADRLRRFYPPTIPLAPDPHRKRWGPPK